MSTIETFFLHAKHWQPFLVFCFGSVAETVAMSSTPFDSLSSICSGERVI
jgi:hypothetical protein